MTDPLQDTFGAAFIGGVVTIFLYGITTLQTYLYFAYYPNDLWPTQLLVGGVWILDTLQTALVTHALYYYLIKNFSNSPALEVGVWSLYTSVLLNVLIAFVTQCFFTQRIFRLSSPKWRWWISGVTGLIVVLHLAFGLDTVAHLLIKPEFELISEIVLSAATPFAIFAVLSDVIVAAALCLLLRDTKNKTVFRSTTTVINRLMIYAINRCLLTSVVALIETITFALKPKTFWFLGLDFVIGKLYANSLLATLNARHSLRGKGAEDDYHSVQLSKLDPPQGSRSISFVPEPAASDATDGTFGFKTPTISGTAARSRVVTVDIAARSHTDSSHPSDSSGTKNDASFSEAV